MGRRSNKRKSFSVIKDLMDKLSLTDSSNASNASSDSSRPSSPTPPATKRFILDPSHPFYWHLSNRENRPKSTAESSNEENPECTNSQPNSPEIKLVITKVKNSKKRHKKRKIKKNYAKTTGITSAGHANTSRPSSLAKVGLNRRQMKRASKKSRNVILKRRVVNTVLANDLDQLSLS